LHGQLHGGAGGEEESLFKRWASTILSILDVYLGAYYFYRSCYDGVPGFFLVIGFFGHRSGIKDLALIDLLFETRERITWLMEIKRVYKSSDYSVLNIYLDLFWSQIMRAKKIRIACSSLEKSVIYSIYVTFNATPERNISFSKRPKRRYFLAKNKIEALFNTPSNDAIVLLFRVLLMVRVPVKKVLNKMWIRASANA
jgi:hypothetical protein